MKIGIVGAGTFGSGFAALLLKSGFDVSISDKSEANLKRGLQNISLLLAQLAQKNMISLTDREFLMQKIRESTDSMVHKEADIIIEAVSEKLNAKKNVISELDRISRQDAVLATCTSSIPIDAIAKAAKTPERVVGIHVINPLSSSAIEIVGGKLTSPKARRSVRTALEKMFKTIIEVESLPMSSKIVFGMINEAAHCVRDGAAAENVDALMKLGVSHPIGPLEFADSIGIDVVVDTLNNLKEKSDKFRPCPLLTQMVHEGKLGKKSGKGFYDYMK